MAVILLAFWSARHLHHGSLGFYEDDYTLVVRAMAASWDQAREFVVDLMTRFGGQGRPLQHSMVFLWGRLAGQLGDREAAYWLAYVLVAVNCTLFYLLLRRLGNRSFALVGGLAYALFSADTTQAFLYHAFGLQQALTYLLLASLAYLSRHYRLAYVIAFGSLLSYETAFLVFAGAPLLEPVWDRSWRRRLVQHGLAILAILALAAIARLTIGEGRVAGLEPADIVSTAFVHTLQGPVVALGSYVLRPLQALLNLDPEVAAVSSVSFVLFLWVLRRLPPPSALGGPAPSELPAPDSALDRLAPRLGPVDRNLRTLLAGLAMLALAYPLTFTVRAYAVSGRDTRVHMAAAVGASLTWASGWSFGISWTKRAGARLAANGALAASLSLLVGFGVVVQKDYARAWELQQRFWTSLIEYVPDLDDGAVVFVDPAGLDDTRYIDANTWNLPLVLKYIYDFPDGWHQQPRVYRLNAEWRQRSLLNPLEFKALDYSWNYVVVGWDDAIVLETSEGRVVDRVDQVELASGSHVLKRVPDRLPDRAMFSPGFLYADLIRVPNADRACLGYGSHLVAFDSDVVAQEALLARCP